MYANGETEEQMDHRQEVMEWANKCGCTLTGKPDGSEAVTVVFTPDQWCKFIDQIDLKFINTTAKEVPNAERKVLAS